MEVWTAFTCGVLVGLLLAFVALPVLILRLRRKK